MQGRAVAAAVLLAAALVTWPSANVLTTDDEPVLVLVTLREQPAVQLAAETRPLVADALTAAELDRARTDRAAALMQRLARVVPESQVGVRQEIGERGGQVVYAARAFNAVAARVPRSALEALRARPDVVAVDVDEPRHALLDHLSGATLASAFWDRGVTGGAVDVAVIDTGLFVEHEAFVRRAGSVIGQVFHRNARSYDKYYDVPTDPDDYAGHGTLVSGMVFSQPLAWSTRKGLAFGLDKLYNLKAGFAVYPSGGSSFLSDLMEAVDWSLQRSDPPEVYNYSFGAKASADDDAYARFWDGVVDSFGKVATISAGNSGSADGTLNSPGIAYNVITVANVNSRGTISRGDDVIATSSSRGPTLDGRRKPDLAAPGSALTLPSHFGPASWTQASGTSFSSPGVAGAAALLMDAGVTDPRAVKAVLINTSDDLGAPGWDNAFGWGYYNGARAFEERASWSLDTYGPPGTATSVRFLERRDAARTRATLVWHRHVSYAIGGSVPTLGTLNNLDVRLYAEASGTLRAASTSPRDNVERVTSDTAEPAVLVIRTASPFSGSSETAALAHSGGFVARVGPSISLQGSAPLSVSPLANFEVTAVVGNPGDLRGHAYEVTLAVPDGYTLVSPGATQVVSSLAAAEQSALTWTVRARSSAAPAQPFALQARTTSYGFSWEASASIAVGTVLGCTYSTSTPPPVSADGGRVTMTVTTAPGCTWSARSSVSWLSIASGASGAGPGDVVVAAAANSGNSRTASVDVAGQSVTVMQRATAAAVEARHYYLAEGATGSFFDLDVIVANPNVTAAPIALRFLRGDGQVITRTDVVAARARRTIHVNDIPGLAVGDVSTVVESLDGLPLIVERTMAWAGGEGYGAHGGTAVDGPRREWYFAEGSQGFFDTYLLLANPGTTPVRARVSFLREYGPPVEQVVEVAPTSRYTLFAGHDARLVDRSFSITVSADGPIIAERAMYWSNGGTQWIGGHESAGVPSPATEWWLPEGATGPYFETFLLVGNPAAEPARLTVRYLLPSGRVLTREYLVAAYARLTVNVEGEDDALRDTAVSMSVAADRPVVAERAMYWPGTSTQWHEAHNSFGVTGTGLRWGLADGCVGGARRVQTYLLLANPDARTALVAVTFLPESGAAFTRTFSVAPTSRFNIELGSEVPELTGTCFGAVVASTNDVPIAVERAMYWDARGVPWSAGTNATAVALP